MSLRRAGLGLMLVMLGAFRLSAAAPPSEPSSGSPGVQVADLKQQLEAGLRVQRPQDFAFVARVVDMVKDGQLPLDLVKSTFAWARQKNSSYPVVYFEWGLRARAAKLNIYIPVPVTAPRRA